MELRPADIAKECDVSVGTVRNWCTEYAEFLSTGANPNDGNRLLNERDLEIFRYIVSLRKDGMSKPQVVLRLRETTFGHVDTEQPIVKSTEALQSLQESHQDAPAALMALDAITVLQRRMEAVERSREPSFVVGLGLGFIGALLFMIVLIGLAVLYGGFR